MTIPPSYASVSIEKICQPDFEELELEILGGDGEKTLNDALHSIILWPKHYIVIIPENDGSPRDPLEPLQSSPGPSSSLPLSHLFRKNHTTIWEKRAPAIMMMTSLPIHLSNHRPQSHICLERNLSSRCNHQRKNENDQ
jgi:hypothetical protein